MKEAVLTIAALSRHACEEWSKESGEFDSEDLTCMCAMASHFLFRRLAKAGFVPVFLIAEAVPAWGSHCWVRVGKTHIDLTATQFEDKCSPIYNYRGSKTDHPIMREYFRKWSPKFPDEFNIFTAATDNGIMKLLKEWPSEQLLNAKVDKQILQFYKG
jgi:hypothetical protein